MKNNECDMFVELSVWGLKEKYKTEANLLEDYDDVIKQKQTKEE